jgi:predicted outer membrane repeat protein
VLSQFKGNAQNIIYVNPNATGNNDGTSWTNAYINLQEAIDSASSSVVDTLKLAADTIYLTETAKIENKDVVVKGGYNTTTNIQEGYTALDPSQIDTASNVTSDGSLHYKWKVMKVNGYGTAITSNTKIDHLILQNGKAYSGGALYNQKSSAEYSDLIIRNNTAAMFDRTNSSDPGAGYGGAVFLQEGSPIFTNVVFEENIAERTTDGGGAVYIYESTPTFTNVTFRDNSAYYGGAVYVNACNPTFEDVVFEGNAAEFYGGAFYNSGGDCTLGNVFFINNIVNQFGGAMFNYNATNTTLTNLVFSGNQATDAGYVGGALFNQSSSISVVNSVFVNNSADYGGAVCGYADNSVFTNITLCNNSATSGGGVYAYGTSSQSFYNTVFYNNGSDIDGDNINTSSSNNASDGTGGGISTTSNFVALSSDPFVSSSNPIGSDGTWATSDDGLYPTSGALIVGVGDNSFNSTTTDLGGQTRIQKTTIDLGAYESSFSSGAELKLWLRADKNASGSKWVDYSGNDYEYTQSDSKYQPTYNDNRLNFNPALIFDDDDPNSLYYSGTNADLYNSDVQSVFIVMRRDTSSTDMDIAYYLSNGSGSSYDGNGGSNTINFEKYWGFSNDSNSEIESFNQADTTTTDKFWVTSSGYDCDIALLSSLRSSGAVTLYGNSELQATGSGVFTEAKVTYSIVGSHGAGLTAGSNSERCFDGDICEIISYNDILSSSERIKVESYLAVKYGLTLNNVDYLSCDSTVIWEVTSGYNNDIFGLGRDDADSLDQRISKSVNDTTVLTLSLDNNFEVSNIDTDTRTTEHTNDNQFVLLGSNDGDLEFTKTDLPEGYQIRMVREWKVQNTNFAQQVYLQFDSCKTNSDIFYYAIVDTINGDGDFSDADYTIMLDANGITKETVSLPDGATVTVVKNSICPGGVYENLQLWVRADKGTDDWASDQWYDSYTGVAYTLVNGPTINTDSLHNFNPGVTFTGPQTSLRPYVDCSSVNFRNFTAGLSTFVLVNPDDNNTTTTARIWSLRPSTSSGSNCIFFQGDSDNSDFCLNVYPASGSPTGTESTGGALVNNMDNIYSGFLAAGNSGGSTTGTLYVNNTLSITNSSAKLPKTANRSSYNGIGADATTSGGYPFSGDIPEVIIYNKELSATERLKVNSYLALKYGITLDQTTATNYIASDSTIIWNASDAGTYNNNIFGIGRDDVDALYQRISKSVNDSAIVTLSLSNDFTSSNLSRTEAITDLNFQTIANNGGDTAWTTTNAPACFKILDRVWQVQETGTIGEVYIKFDVDDEDFNVPDVLNGTKYYIVIDTDGDGDLSDEMPDTLSASNSYTYDFTDETLFTLATADSLVAVTDSIEVCSYETQTLSVNLMDNDSTTQGLVDQSFFETSLVADTSSLYTVNADGTVSVSSLQPGVTYAVEYKIQRIDYPDIYDIDTLITIAHDTVYAGKDTTIFICGNANSIDFDTLLGGTQDEGGVWKPDLTDGVFDPSVNTSGTYAYIVLDNSICANNDTAYVIVTLDNEAPVLTIPSDTTIDCTSSTDTANTGAANAVDGFSDVTIYLSDSVVEACGVTDTIFRKWYAVDECGNSSGVLIQRIIVQDTTPPVFVEENPADTVIDCGVVFAEATLTATDECNNATVTYTADTVAGVCPNIYEITRTWIAEDDCGNRGSVQQVVIIQDTTSPVFSEDIPSDTVIDCGVVFAETTLTATDECSSATVTYTADTVAGVCPNIYEITRTWIAEDDCGNRDSAQQVVIVQDTTPPVFVEDIPADTTVDCDAIPDSASITAVDGCGDATVVYVVDTLFGCYAGNDAPELSSDSIILDCSSTTTDLSTITAGNKLNLSYVSLKWYNDSGLTTVLSDLSSVSAGTYFAVFYDAENDCFSPSTEFKISTADCGIYWDGSESTVWDNAANWSNNEVPASTANAIIPAGCTNYPILTEDETIETLTIESGANVTIDTAAIFTVNGTLTNNAGVTGLVLESKKLSDSTSVNGMLMNNTEGVQATVKLYYTHDNYHMLGIPVDTSICNDVMPYAKYLVKCRKSDFSDTNLGNVTNSTAILRATEGYVVRYKSNTVDGLILFTGTLNTGTVRRALEYSGATSNMSRYGHNFASNPYPISVNWDVVRANSTNLLNRYYVLKSGVWSTYVNGVGTNGLTNILSSMQGFLCQANASNPEIVFTNSAKVTNVISYKSATISHLIRLEASSVNSSHSDETIIYLNNNATDGYDDNTDATKMFISNENNISTPEIYTTASDINYAINAVPELENNQLIQLAVKVKAEGQYTISLKELTNLSFNSVYLLNEDQTNTLSDLQQTDYTFTSSADTTHKFYIKLSNSNEVIDGISK